MRKIAEIRENTEMGQIEKIDQIVDIEGNRK